MKIGEIEKNVPIPIRKSGKWANVFRKLEVGDSVSITLEEGENLKSLTQTMRYAACRFRERENKDFHYTIYTEEQNRFRFWRTEPPNKEVSHANKH